MAENKVVLGKYLGLEVSSYEVTVTAEEVEYMIAQQQQKLATTKEVTDRVVANGDTIIFDFAGYVDGVAFDGGTAENYRLTVGSNSFIPGFEPQLVGAEMEKEINVNVTFPKNYHSDNLAGKDALFVCKVHAIEEKVLPEIDDELAMKVAGVATVKELNTKVEEFIKYNKEQEAKKGLIDEAINQIVATSTVELADEVLEREVSLLRTQMESQLMQQGMNMDTYLSMCGLTIDQLNSQFMDLAKDRATKMAILNQIAVVENLKVTEEDVNRQLSLLAQMYQMTEEQIREAIDMKEFEESLLTALAAELVANNMITK